MHPVLFIVTIVQICKSYIVSFIGRQPIQHVGVGVCFVSQPDL